MIIDSTAGVAGRYFLTLKHSYFLWINYKIKSSTDLSDLFSEMFREGIQVLLQAEMDEHLGYLKHAPEYSNSRNGKTSKHIKSKFGEYPIEVPRDWNSSFQLQLIPKHSRILAEIEDHVLSLYTHGISMRDIESHIKELYGVEMSEATSLTQPIV